MRSFLFFAVAALMVGLSTGSHASVAPPSPGGCTVVQAPAEARAYAASDATNRPNVANHVGGENNPVVPTRTTQFAAAAPCPPLPAAR